MAEAEGVFVVDRPRLPREPGDRRTDEDRDLHHAERAEGRVERLEATDVARAGLVIGQRALAREDDERRDERRDDVEPEQDQQDRRPGRCGTEPRRRGRCGRCEPPGARPRTPRAASQAPGAAGGSDGRRTSGPERLGSGASVRSVTWSPPPNGLRSPPIRTTQRPRAAPATMPSSAGSSVSSVTSVTCSPSSRGRRSVASRSQMPASPRDRHVDRVHPQQGDPAEDEREDRRRRAPPRRRCRWRPPRRRSCSVRRTYGSVARADGVDRPGPSLRLERLALGGHLVPRQDPGRPSAAAVRLVGLAGRGPDLVAALGEDRQRRAADAAARAGHEDRPVVGRQTALLERRRPTSPAVNPAVPIAIASRADSPGASGTTQPAGTRSYSA